MNIFLKILKIKEDRGEVSLGKFIFLYFLLSTVYFFLVLTFLIVLYLLLNNFFKKELSVPTFVDNLLVVGWILLPFIVLIQNLTIKGFEKYVKIIRKIISVLYILWGVLSAYRIIIDTHGNILFIAHGNLHIYWAPVIISPVLFFVLLLLSLRFRLLKKITGLIGIFYLILIVLLVGQNDPSRLIETLFMLSIFIRWNILKR